MWKIKSKVCDRTPKFHTELLEHSHKRLIYAFATMKNLQLYPQNPQDHKLNPRSQLLRSHTISVFELYLILYII